MVPTFASYMTGLLGLNFKKKRCELNCGYTYTYKLTKSLTILFAASNNGIVWERTSKGDYKKSSVKIITKFQTQV